MFGRLVARCRQLDKPVLVGDFNCVLHPLDVEANFLAKSSPALLRLVNDLCYVDAYRVLHPATRQFSFYRRGGTASRLDKVLLPPLLESAPRVARYVATPGDHHAFVLRLEAASLGLRPPPPRGARASFYWKLNVAALAEPGFMDGLELAWGPLAAARPPDPLGDGEWWEQVAKPGLMAFCKAFSKEAAAQRFQTRRFFVQALEMALLASDWPTVEACRGRIAEVDKWLAAGAAVRARCDLVEGEEAGVYQMAAEGRWGSSPGRRTVRKEDGQVLHEAEEVEEEVLSFFEAIFQGRHVAAEGSPVDSGVSFVPNEGLFSSFLDGLPTLSPEDAEMMEQPFSLHELAAALEGAASNKSPGLDGLPYEFYGKALPVVGEAMLSALNAMLASGRLGKSLRTGVVRLLPKVAGHPMAAQLRPITLLTTDYKLLTKMLVGRFVRVLPSVLRSTQLCSVKGRTIFDGAATIVSAAEFAWRKRRPGFLVSLDFFHAYDRVSLLWVDRILAAMGFSPLLRGWVATLHREAAATFMLHTLSPELRLLFSIRQGDPLAMILFVIHVEPYLVRLERELVGMFVGQTRVASQGYVDDVSALGSDPRDIIVLDRVTKDFELVSGAILNRNCKSVIVGLGTWAGRQDWPLPWLEVVDGVKIFGVVFTPVLAETVAQTWDRVAKGVEKSLAAWGARGLATLGQRKVVVEVFALSKVWYFAQVLPMPQEVAARLERAASNFLWLGRLERLAWSELHSPLHQGGLGVSCVFSRAQALWVKQAARQLAAGGLVAKHLAYWMGLRLRAQPVFAVLPFSLSAGPHAEVLPPFYRDLSFLLLEVAKLGVLDDGQMEVVQAKAIYKEFLSSPPPPKVEARLGDIPWWLAWGRLATAGMPGQAVDVAFMALHNILPLQVRRFRFGLAATPDCQVCGAVEDVLHFFVSCPRVADAWAYLAWRVTLAIGGPVADRRVLFLAWPPSVEDLHVTLAVLTFLEWVWEFREGGDLVLGVLVARVQARATGHFRSIC